MKNLLRRALALVLAANMAVITAAPPAYAKMSFEAVGLPAATANTDGSVSIPAKAAPAGSTVTFYVEGLPVGTAVAAADGSAVLAKPTYPAGTGARVQYGAIMLAPSVTAPTPVIPPYPTIGNVLPAPNALTAMPWQGGVGGDALTAPTSTTTRWVQSTADTSNRSLYQNPLKLSAGQYTFGATVVRNAASSDSLLRVQNGYGQAAFPASAADITTGTPYRTSVTFTADGNGSFFSLNKPAGLSASDYTIYNVSITPGATDPYTAGDAPATVPIPATDYAGQFLTTTNWPTQLPPAVPGTLPSGNLRLQAGATNLVAMDFSSTGNVKDRATFDSMTFPTAITGDVSTVIGNGTSNAVDGANATKSYARYRRFPPGHPYDLHTFTPDGLKLGVVGAKNNQSPFKGPASGSSVQVYAGGFRLEQPILPGMTVERIVKFGSNSFSWNCIWMFVGTQVSPARYAIAKNTPSMANNPYAFGVNQTGALLYTARHTVNGTTKSPYYEIDDHDAWWEKSLGDYLQGMPAGVVRPDDATDSDALVVPPYTYFLPGDNGFGFTAGSGQNHAKLLATLNDGQFHSVVVNWPDDGKDRIQFIIDGKLFMEQHFEYLMDPYTDPLTGTVQKVGMHLLIGGQSIPGFVPGADTGSLAITDRDSLAMVVKSVKVWKGNLDESTIVKPTNALTSTYGALASTTTTGSTGGTTTLAITGLQASGTKLTATANDGTAMTVSGANVSGTFTSAGTKTIAITEHPYAAKGIGLGVPRTTNLTVAIAAPADLQNLAITPTSVNVGMPYTGTVSPTASGSTVTVASNDNTTLTPSGTGTSRTIKGTFFTAGTPSLTPTETLAGSSNSPKTSPATTLNVLADSPTGANLITTPNDPAYWSSSTLTFTTGQADPTGGTAAYNAIPTTTNGLHRMSKTFTGLTAGATYRLSFTLKPFGTGPGSRYYMINAGTMGQVTFDLQTLTATTSTTGPNTNVPAGGYFISSAGSGFYKVSIQGVVASTSQNILPALMNGLSTDDTSSAGLFAGDGTSGITVFNARMGVP